MEKSFKVMNIRVDRLPESCQDCRFAVNSENGRAECLPLQQSVCTSYWADYRRHDCPLYMAFPMEKEG